MASSRKPTYKVDAVLAIDRKRRKSDLVVMWQSIWDVTAIVVKELWLILLRIWDLIHLWFMPSQRFQIQTWLEKYLSFAPEDFSHSWRDGQLLGILLNKLQPGCFPEANKMDPNYGLRNVYKVFDALDTHFGIKPSVSAEEIVTCADGSEEKLLELLLKLKESTDNQPEPEESISEPDAIGNIDEPCDSHCCIAKGTGLAVGFVGRISNFIIFCALMADLDIVVEIKGPTTICSERITKKSPKKKRSMMSWEHPRPLRRSVSYNEKTNSLVSESERELVKRIIPLEYEIIGNQVSLSYKPKEKGKHKLTILWHGQHVSDSPYTVTVDDPSEIVGLNSVNLKSALKSTSEGEKNSARKISVRFQECQESCSEPKRYFGKIRSKRILRYIVRIHGEDVPVNAENTESLATELLKMDYDLEKYPSFHRRNSWGFAGDAERKKSLIRQFGIDVHELEAQSSSRRSRSLSIQTSDRSSLQKSCSFDNLTSKLKTANKYILESANIIHDENEEDYGYINEDSSLIAENAEEMDENEPELQSAVISEVELIKPNLERCLKKNSTENRDKVNVKNGKISSSSIHANKIKAIDDSNVDLKEDFSANSLFLQFNHKLEEEDVFDKKSLQVKNSNIDNSVIKKSNFYFPPCLQQSVSKTISNTIKSKQSQRIKNGRKNVPLYRRKKSGKIRVINKNRKLTFHIKISKNKISVFLTPNVLRKNWLKNKYIKNIYLNFLPWYKLKKLKTLGEKCGTSKNIHNINCSFKDLNIPVTKSLANTVNEQNIKFSQANEKFSVQSNIKRNVPASNSWSRNVDDSCKNVKDVVDKQESTLKESIVLTGDINLGLKTVKNSVSMSNIKPQNLNAIYQKRLRTHTLRRLGQFHFKQFNPLPEIQGSTSPVKSQIVLWENSLSTDKQNESLKKNCPIETESGSVKEKLAFWENTLKTELKSSNQVLEQNRQLNLTSNKKLYTSENSSEAMLDNLQNPGNDAHITDMLIKVEIESCNFANTEISNVTRNKGDKLFAKFENGTKLEHVPKLETSSKSQSRSFSDPETLETTDGLHNECSAYSSLNSFSDEYLYSSNDDNLGPHVSDEEFSCNDGDHSEDEYIDDEIPESSYEYWGDLSILKDFKLIGCENENSFWNETYLKNQLQEFISDPLACKVFGIAIYYGNVAVKNQFQVFTGNAGFGSLSVSVQGLEQHRVTLVSVIYMRNDIYEVTYQVLNAGYYLISIRWMDKDIRGSPFLCKVTF